MEFRADLYAAGGQWRRTERYIARHEVEAINTARGLVVALGLDHARLYACDGRGLARLITEVGAEQ
ncbi:hypothetical protein ABZ814_13615 [Micromonospora musae]|uniref:hypothetical protein n=1 Tax=Micromonospora musae TaxID=1894970 RepID=UPI0033CAEF08